MAADHIKEPYVKQIEESSHAFQEAIKALPKDKNSKEWKTQFDKCGIQLEHYQTLVKGFDDEFAKTYKNKSAPNEMLKLQERVKKQNVAVNFTKALLKK